MSINKSKFNTIGREVLLATLVYLGGPNMSDFTKPAIIDSVIARIDHHLPHSCYTCKEEYTIPQGVKSLLDCSKCGRGVHDQCFLKQIKHPAANDNSISPTPNDIMKQYVNPLEITGITNIPMRIMSQKFHTITRLWKVQETQRQAHKCGPGC